MTKRDTNIKDKMHLTIKEFAKLTSISERSIRKIVQMEGFPMFFSGNRTIIIKDMAIDWIKQNFSKIKA